MNGSRQPLRSAMGIDQQSKPRETESECPALPWRFLEASATPPPAPHGHHRRRRRELRELRTAQTDDGPEGGRVATRSTFPKKEFVHRGIIKVCSSSCCFFAPTGTRERSLNHVACCRVSRPAVHPSWLPCDGRFCATTGTHRDAFDIHPMSATDCNPSLVHSSTMKCTVSRNNKRQTQSSFILHPPSSFINALHALPERKN